MKKNKNNKTQKTMEEEIIRLASLVGTDVRNPEEKLTNFINQQLEKERKRIGEELRKWFNQKVEPLGGNLELIDGAIERITGVKI